MAKMVKKADEQLSTTQKAVLKVMGGKAAAKGLKAGEIAAKVFPGDAAGAASVRHQLSSLLERKLIKRVARGTYAAA